MWREPSFPRDLARKVEHPALNGLWVLTTFSPLCESSIKKTFLVYGFRDPAYSGWLLGDPGSAAVDRSRSVLETDALCYGSWAAEKH